MLRNAMRFALVAIVAGAFCCSAMAKGTEIKIDRTHTVGQIIKEVGTFEENVKLDITEKGKVETKSQAIKAVYDIDIKVTETAGDKRVTGAELTINKWEASFNGKAVDRIKPGMKITLKELKSGPLFEHSEINFDQIESALLEMCMPPMREENEDPIFGSKEAKEVGAKWAYDKKVSAERLGGIVKPENIAGEAVFEKILPVSGVECARVVVTEKADKFEGFALGEQKLTRINKAIYENKIIFDCPTDLKINAGGSDIVLKLAVEGEINTINGATGVVFSRELKFKGFRTVVK